MPHTPTDSTQPSAVFHKFSHNNLHIKCSSFGQSEANTVMGLMHTFHKECDRIFIDVREIPSPKTSVANAFKTALTNCQITPKQIFFKGQEGFNLAINGNRVLVQTGKTRPKPKGHTCCGKCAHCHCHDHDHDHDHD